MMNKKIIAGVAGMVGIIGVGLGGWFYWDNIKTAISSEKSIVSESKSVNFNESYNLLVDGFVLDLKTLLEKSNQLTNSKQNLTLTANGSVNEFKGDINITMSGISNNSGTISQTNGLLDMFFVGNLFFPKYEDLTQSETVSSDTGLKQDSINLTGSLSLLVTQGKLYGVIKSFLLNSSDPKFMMAGGFVSAYLNKWIMLGDLLEKNNSFSSDMNSSLVYSELVKYFDLLKQYPLIVESGNSTIEGEYTVYNFKVENNNIVSIYKDIINSTLMSSVQGTDKEELLNSVNELSGAIASSNITGKMKVKNSNNIILTFDSIKVNDLSTFSGYISKVDNKFNAVFELIFEDKFVLTIEKDKLTKISGEYISKGSRLGGGTIEINSKILDNGIIADYNINGSGENVNFNVKMNNNIEGLSEVATGIFTIPEGATNLEDLIPAF